METSWLELGSHPTMGLSQGQAGTSSRLDRLSKCVRNRREDTPSSTGSQDVRCRQVDDSEKRLISLD